MMKIHGVVRLGNRPLFMKWGKHYCPVCNTLLKKVKTSNVINSQSPEAKQPPYKNHIDDMVGNIKFIWSEFACETCQKNYSTNEVYEAERSRLV